jgi:hypothetical protein
MTVVHTVFKALAPAIPARVIAGHHAVLSEPSSPLRASVIGTAKEVSEIGAQTCDIGVSTHEVDQ